MYSYYAAPYQGHFSSHRTEIEPCFLTMLKHVKDFFLFSSEGTEPCIFTMLQHIRGIFCPLEQETCILTMLQHVSDIFCLIEQNHVFSLCCSFSVTILPHETEICILTILQHTGDIFLSTCILTVKNLPLILLHQIVSGAKSRIQCFH